MRKLKLESLHVESFETTGNASLPRGTVDGHADLAPNTRGCPVDTIEPNPSYCVICYPVSYDRRCEPLTYDPADCGITQYLDCTFGCTYRCSQNTGCVDICWVEADTPNCAVE